ncbi:Putative FAS1 domain-containing protein [Septoria linicola]|uniref:FAS1 domain-containing protein n=1 Tax=Septoria linicola TaxID=215465 RepID=A0A9Q9EGE5_9PEZI|nr:Putative FAS1 domain-containing protein [Septoria linicola]
MKLSTVLLLAAVTSAFVLPSEQVLSELKIEDHHAHRQVESWLDEATHTKDEVLSSFKKHFDEVTESTKDAWKEISQSGKSVLDQAFEKAEETAESFGHTLEGAADDLQAYVEDSDLFKAFEGDHEHPPHHRKPEHPPHHHKPNETLYQLISGSKYTTKLAKLISEYDDLVDALNSTSANFTVFAPTDSAFEKIPEHAPKPSKEQLKAILSYHVVPDVYTAGRVLVTHTVPTLLKGEHLSSQPEPQRLAFKLGLRGLTVNFYSRIVAINILGTNGVIHGVDSIILPPPNAITLVDLFPGEFSTLELGLGKTGLLEKLNTTHHAGGTLFAPSNFAFQKLGPKINAFLFSQYGRKYLKALLEYHVVPGNTLYSDAYYKAKDDKDAATTVDIPKGLFHVDLPTLLKDRGLSVDIARYGGFISIKVNGFATVAVQDGIAEDGVIQVTRDVLIPPKQLGAKLEQWDGSELSVEDLKERLEPFVAKTDL